MMMHWPGSRVVKLISQVLLLRYGIDDNEEKIRFVTLKNCSGNRIYQPMPEG
jgi:hypothetical protein